MVASLVAQMEKTLPAKQETWVQSLGQEDPREKCKATHSSVLAWRIPWTEEPGGLQSMGSQELDTTGQLTHSSSTGFPGDASGKEPTCQCRPNMRRRFDPWVGKVLWRRAWQPIPLFLPGGSYGRGAWWATVHGVAKSRTRQSDFTHSTAPVHSTMSFMQLILRTQR